jgi:hypothetical protein
MALQDCIPSQQFETFPRLVSRIEAASNIWGQPYLLATIASAIMLNNELI